MTGPQLLIAAIVIALVIAFIITMLVVNSNAKKIIDTNTRLVENQNLLVELNKQQGSEIERRMNELEEQSSVLEQQKSELDEQKGMIEILDLVVHERAYNMMTLDFIYTDANGKETTMKLDKNSTPNAQLTDMEKNFFDSHQTLALYRGEEAEQRYPGINDYLDTKHMKVYRVTLNNVEVGKTIKTNVKSYILDSYQPKEKDDYELMPVVFVTRNNYGQFMSSSSLSLYFFSASNWDKLKEKINEKELPCCMNIIEVF